MPDKQTTEKIADLFKAFADPARVMMVIISVVMNIITVQIRLSQLRDLIMK